MWELLFPIVGKLLERGGQPMIYLIIFMVLADGQATAYALKQPTMQACEAKLPELRREVMGIESVRRYSLTCSRMEGKAEPM